ncbi:MAG: hypothetical protein ABI678_25555 [Kofleriaceae bacterium]
MLVHFARLSLVLSLLALPLVSACGDGDSGDDADAFATLEDCFVDHHDVEMFTVEKAITICCLDHPIGGMEAGMACGPTATTCTDYVDAELDPADATTDEIDAGCADYIVQSGL